MILSDSYAKLKIYHLSRLDLCKQLLTFFHPYKLMNDFQLEKVIDATMRVNESYPKAKAICVFNYNSLANYIRLNESKHVYLDESKIVTKPTKELEDKLLSFYKNEFKSSAYISENLEKCTMFQNEYPVNGGIYGTIIFSAVVDFAVMSINEFVNRVSRVANLFGYNYVNSDILTASAQMTASNGTMCTCGSVFVQFEASYVDGTSLIVGNSVYHVTTKNVAEKIINQHRGLVPYNKCKKGFNYDACVYCFTDMTGNIDKEYAKMSGKQNIVFLRKDHEFFTPQVLNMLKVLSMKNDGAVIDLKKFVVLQIDTSKLVDMKFYRDNNTTNANGNLIAIYTLQNIPYQAISAIKTFVIQ